MGILVVLLSRSVLRLRFESALSADGCSLVSSALDRPFGINDGDITIEVRLIHHALRQNLIVLASWDEIAIFCKTQPYTVSTHTHVSLRDSAIQNSSRQRHSAILAPPQSSFELGDKLPDLEPLFPRARTTFDILTQHTFVDRTDRSNNIYQQYSSNFQRNGLVAKILQHFHRSLICAVERSCIVQPGSH